MPRGAAMLACSVFLNQGNLSWGLQPSTLSESEVWVLPSPSGLNCTFIIGKLTEAYRELFAAAAVQRVL
jgi:TDG/mug DNA glycosylase family protein